MMNDQRTSYRWQDHVVTPRRAALNLLATAVIVALVGAAGFAGHDPAPAAHVRIATEQASSLAQSVKRPALLHPSPSHPGTGALNGC
jgi:hypothetical protein